MSEAAIAAPVRRSAATDSLVTMAWRNLWRVRRRTWLTVAGVAFAIFFVVLANSMQRGTFAVMIDNVTGILSGHVQAQHPAYQDDPRPRNTVADAAALRTAIMEQPGVRAATLRGMAFALVSAGSEGRERTFGAQIIGMDPITEFASIRRPATGRFIAGPGEAFIGAGLARNLNANAGDELVVLGTAKEGGVAAVAVTLAGTFESGMTELDRATLALHFEDFAEAFGLGGEAHAVAILADDSADAEAVAERLATTLDGGAAPVRFASWETLRPELVQFVELKAWGAYLISALLIVLVTFGVMNAFVMAVFERTAEFGMLKAIGMTPGAIRRMLQIEALWMSVLGVAVGVGISAAVIGALSAVGISLGEEYSEMLERFNMPDRLYPTFDYATAFGMAALMVVAVQLAALLPTRRLRKLNVVEALREQE